MHNALCVKSISSYNIVLVTKHMRRIQKVSLRVIFKMEMYRKREGFQRDMDI